MLNDNTLQQFMYATTRAKVCSTKTTSKTATIAKTITIDVKCINGNKLKRHQQQKH